MQNVNITLRILFRPVASQLPRIFTSIGEDYDERVLPSITTEILKSVVVSGQTLQGQEGRPRAVTVLSFSRLLADPICTLSTTRLALTPGS